MTWLSRLIAHFIPRTINSMGHGQASAKIGTEWNAVILVALLLVCAWWAVLVGLRVALDCTDVEDQS